MEALSKSILDDIPVNRRFRFGDAVLECVEDFNCSSCYFSPDGMGGCGKCSMSRADGTNVIFEEVDPDMISPGTTIEYKGVVYECVKGENNSCDGCAFHVGKCCCECDISVFGRCYTRVVNQMERVKFIKKEMKKEIPERKIDDTFIYNGESYRCVEGDLKCHQCCFWGGALSKCEKPDDFGYCSPGPRHDRKNVFFLKIPYEVIPLSKDAPIGSVVEYKEDLYQVLESEGCRGCYFSEYERECPGSLDDCPCAKEQRIDGKGVIFVRYLSSDGDCIRKNNIKEKKTYFKVGEEFQVGLIRMKCVECDQSCNGCFFYNIDNPSIRCHTHIIGECTAGKRQDRKSVKFIKVDE